jgi:hemerythrin-like domain-containing protein
MPNEVEVTPIEDLMREHGLLNRLLLVYEEIVRRLEYEIPMSNCIITSTAKIIHKFVEDYHEKTEERYVFPLLIEHGVNIDMVNELLEQHQLGRRLTDNIIKLSSEPKICRNKLIKNIKEFVRMYRYHESREDTVVFQNFRDLLSEKEYVELGEKFEKDEELAIGKDGYHKTLIIVEEIEKYLDIYDLSNITDELKFSMNNL